MPGNDDVEAARFMAKVAGFFDTVDEFQQWVEVLRALASREDATMAEVAEAVVQVGRVGSRVYNGADWARQVMQAVTGRAGLPRMTTAERAELARRSQEREAVMLEKLFKRK